MLEQMLADMESAPAQYRPTNFWSSGLQAIVDDIDELGIESFRQHESARRMYVPSYTNDRQALRRAGNLIDRLPYGRTLADRLVRNTPRAQADYRVLLAADRPGRPDLSTVSESEHGRPLDQMTFGGRRFSKSMLNYLRGLAFLKRHVDTADLRVVMEIGGGYGTVGEILAAAHDDTLYIDIDIPPVAYVATWYLQQLLGEEQVFSYDRSRAMDELSIEAISADYRSAVFCPWQIEQLTGEVDLFVNFISFQEMEPAVVENYANQVARFRPRHVLLRNSRAGKDQAAPGEIGVIEPVVQADYLRYFADYHLVAADAEVFGETFGTFSSEVLLLERRTA